MYDIFVTFTSIVFLILYVREHHLHLKVKNELTQIASQVALTAASQLNDQAPIINQYMDLLQYLATNPGHSIDDASKVINELKKGIDEVNVKVSNLKTNVVKHVENIENNEHHLNLLEYLRQNPGNSIEQAKEYLLSIK